MDPLGYLIGLHGMPCRVAMHSCARSAGLGSDLFLQMTGQSKPMACLSKPKGKGKGDKGGRQPATPIDVEVYDFY